MKFFLILALLVISGCAKPGRAIFVDVVNDHRQVTVETMEAVKKSIQDEIDAKWSDLTDDEKKSILDLLARLELISKQSELIQEYVQGDVDQELLADLLEMRWSNPSNELFREKHKVY